MFEDRHIGPLNETMETIYQTIESRLDLSEADTEMVQETLVASLPLVSRVNNALPIPRFKLSIHQGTYRFFEPIVTELLMTSEQFY